MFFVQYFPPNAYALGIKATGAGWDWCRNSRWQQGGYTDYCVGGKRQADKPCSIFEIVTQVSKDHNAFIFCERLLGLLESDNYGITILRNIGNHLAENEAQYPQRL